MCDNITQTTNTCVMENKHVYNRDSTKKSYLNNLKLLISPPVKNQSMMTLKRSRFLLEMQIS